MRPFRREDEGLLFGVAKLAFADCDDGRTIATLTRDTVFVAELAGEPAGYVALEESAASAPDRTALCASGPRGGRGRQPAARLGRGLRDLAGVGPARGRRRARERPRRRPSTAAAGSSRPGRTCSSSSFRRRCSLARPPRPRSPSRRRRRRTRGSSARSRPTAPCSRPRRRTSSSSSTTRSARPGATESSTRAGRSVLAGSAHRLAGNDRALVLPLRARPRRAARTPSAGASSRTTATWSPACSPSPSARARRGRCRRSSAGGGTSIASVVLRFLFLAGVLVAGGAALTGRVLLERGRRRLETGRRGRPGAGRRRRASGCWRSSRPPTRRGSAA